MNKISLLVLLLVLLFSCKKESINTQNNTNNPIDTTTNPIDTTVIPIDTTNHSIDSINNVFYSKKYNQVCFLMTHNAMNNTEKGYWFPNQTHSITKQLNDGVRGLMIDTYNGNDGNAITYHGVEFAGSQKLVDVLKEVLVFLSNNPKEIVTIIFENQGSNDQLIKAIQDAYLEEYTYVHNGTWKTLKEMIDANQRLVLFAEFNKTPSANYLHYAWSTIFDTKYEYKNVNQFDCDVNRGSNNGTNSLFLINHWLGNIFGVPEKKFAYQANTREVLSKRVNECTAANNHFLNFLGIDFYEIGAAKAIVDSINYTPN
ncbi:MAG: phosphatidylinositol-specific phospholipase C domain-containing protein [Sphingobacteriales bacterium]|jgi:hypothetical protein|nr:MAG: phosphatidylinositol-specific phospholipase C domain-containing protein [Sphingobacteriales bacterium]